MPLPQNQLDAFFNVLRQKGAESQKALDEEFQATKDWAEAALEDVISHKNPSTQPSESEAKSSTNTYDGASCSGASLDQSILEASRIAVEETMKGPARLTRLAPLPSKSANDSGLYDVHFDDSSDEENQVLPYRKRGTQLNFAGLNFDSHEYNNIYISLCSISARRAAVLNLQHKISHSQLFTFFGSEKSTPDLSKLFNDIDKRLLARCSSAVWHSPERKKLANSNE